MKQFAVLLFGTVLLAGCVSGNGAQYLSNNALSCGTSIFTGSASCTTMNSGGGVATLANYNNVTVSTTWGANNATGQFALGMADATGAGSDTGTIPHLANAVVYLSLVSSSPVTFTQTPSITVSGSALVNGDACNGASWTGTTWQTGLFATSPLVSGNSVTFPAQTIAGGASLNATPTYLAIYCSPS